MVLGGEAVGIPEDEQGAENDQDGPAHLAFVEILSSDEFSYRDEEKFQAEQWEGMRPGCEFESHGANECPNRVIHAENEMIFQVLAIEQSPKLLFLFFGISLLVHDKGDQKQRGHEDAPGRSGESLAFDVDCHPAGHPGIADAAEDEQKPCVKGVELYGLVDLLLFVDERQPPRVHRVVYVAAVYQRFLASTR